MTESVSFLKRIEEPKWSLKIVQRSLKICYYNSVESCVSYTVN